MHLLNAVAGQSDVAEDAIDLCQSAGDIIFLSAADSELNLINQAYERLSERVQMPSLRLANLLQLRNNFSVDLYIEQTLSQARLIIVRLLGGVSYWQYGVEEISKLGHCVFIAGDEKFDESLSSYCRDVEADKCWQLWQYLVHGGAFNAEHFLLLSDRIVRGQPSSDIPLPSKFAKAGLYHPTLAFPSLEDFSSDKPIAAILFYRAYFQAADLEPINSLYEALAERGIQALPIFCSGMKDADSAAQVKEIFARVKPNIILNSLGFHLSGADEKQDISAYWQGVELQAPVLQVILSSQSESLWQSRNNALNIRDIAMYVALTELNGNIFTRAISFKESLPYNENTQMSPAVNKAQLDRIEYVADLTLAYCNLQKIENSEKRVALIMANYPGKDGRLANGVGLDTPASAVAVLQALNEEGYDVEGLEAVSDSQKLMEKLQTLPTNAIAAANKEASLQDRIIEQSLSLQTYKRLFATLPESVQEQITAEWGSAESDPFFMSDRQAFALPFFLCGNVAVGVQPARGYHIDPTATYHDPALVPPHNYCAVYLWLRSEFSTHAVIHLGKHGNLEWLPGKALALSSSCYPEAMLPTVPHIYPFIVNDPGEGSQAKRRTAATIIDHLTPPMLRAENYGILNDLENLCDEYYESLLMDPKRANLLRQEILDFASLHKLDTDSGVNVSADDDEIIAKLDVFLCDLKESQIRGGLHIFMGSVPVDKVAEFGLSLLRYPRFDGEGGNQSILTALARDLGLPLEFNPLDCDFGQIYEGARPQILQEVADTSWRHYGDTVERLSLLAIDILSGERSICGEHSRLVLDYWRASLSVDLAASPLRERRSLVRSLEGRFIAAGSSGAPTRARPDVLPTGRNFYSVDMRAVPTPAAWRIGWSSAQMLVERHAQEHGDYPRQLVLNVWGTSNMRTGGDDIAQALALLGVRPTWDSAAKRVTGFEILPLSLLGRPRIDVTLRISGFFRDAFPSLIELFDKASRQVQRLDESIVDNFCVRHYGDSCAELKILGHDEASIASISGRRIFGSPSGAYGAGLQALIDEGVWQDKADIASAYLAWGSYAYGVHDDGVSDESSFSRILGRTDAVVHNQDNREHDILDSDDYYQFEGGVSAAIETLSGVAPIIYHNDHSNPAAPRVRTLSEEIARTIRARASNPKWISSIMEHGYKGAFELAATVDYLFAFAATTHAVENHHFDLLFDAYIGDDVVRNFILESNPSAFGEILERMEEAVSRGLWKPSRNNWSEFINKS